MIRELLLRRFLRAVRARALRRRLAAAEARECRELDQFMALEAAEAIAWQRDPFPASSYPELAEDPEAHALAVRLHRQLAGEWHVPEEDR